MVKVNLGSSFEKKKKTGGSQVPNAVYQVSRSSAFGFEKDFYGFLPYMGMVM